MVLSSGRASVAALVASIVVVATAAPALAQGYDAKNADKVDGKHATSFTNTASRRRNKLIAANRAGVLPNNIIKMAPNSNKLGGKTLAQVIASATDVYTAGTGLGTTGNAFSLLAGFRLPQGCADGEVAAVDGAGWVCSPVAGGVTYTAGDGLDLTGTVFSLEPGGVTAGHLGTSSVDTDELVDTAVTPGKLSFDPATQTELDGHKGSGDHDGRYFTKTELSTPGGINVGGNPVDWTKLKGVPPGFADGTDADTNTTYTAGTGLNLGGTTFSVNTAVIQSRVGGACAAGSSIRAISADGTVTCEVDDNSTYTAGTGLSLVGNSFIANFAGTGGASTVARSDHNHDATLWKRAGNAGTSGADFIGTTDNQALQLRVNNSRVLQLEPNATSPNVVAGYSSNSATPGVFGATVSGGGTFGTTNRVSDAYGTVSGGLANHAGDGIGSTSDMVGATVGGGEGNWASGTNSTVAGGTNNTVSGIFSTIGGGSANTASGSDATVAGGNSNSASGLRAAVPGGLFNSATGHTSFAAGMRAKANHAGAFVWGDATSADVTSTGNNQFVARASGGVTFYSNSAMTTGVSLAANDGTWASLSDANMKQDFAAVDGRATLDALASVPIGTWRYLGQDDSVLHMGPTAQDFRAAFGLGSDDRHITTIDADGVALSAIQGLYELVQDQQAQIDRLERLVLRRGGMNRVR